MGVDLMSPRGANPKRESEEEISRLPRLSTKAVAYTESFGVEEQAIYGC
jgi:hypothetical protein